MSTEERISLAFSKLGLREPFIAAVVGKLPKHVVSDKGTDFTACTNGEWFKFGQEWIEAHVRDEEELFGLCMHEAMHVVWMHMWRRDGRHPDLWNIANDAIINRNILDMGYKMPSGGVMLDGVTAAMDSEEVYNKLMQEAKDQPSGGDGADEEGEEGTKSPGAGGGSGKQSKTNKKFGKGGWHGTGDLEDSPSDGKRADMEATIRAAAEMARACGASSALVDRILGTPPQATVNWKDEVRAALTSASRDDFTYRRFSRRFLSRGLYLPSLYSEALGGLLIGFDTSGSVSAEDAMQIAGEIQGIIDDLSPDWVEVAYCDTEVTSTQRFQRGDLLALKPTGGGGTRFKPVFDHADKLEQQGEKVAALIYLTDMEGPMDELVEPTFPVVWGNVYGGSNISAPFGKVVRVIVA